MNHTTQRLSVDGALTQVRAVVEPWLEQVNDVLREELDFDCDAVARFIDPQLFFSGKRLRPMLLLLTGKATGQITPEHVSTAAIVEMVHLATLVHDDVLDSAVVRRHRDTINSRHGNHASVLTGDLLFCHAFFLASSVPDSRVASEIAAASRDVCHGEIRQTSLKGNWQVDEQLYLEIIGQKTASLCAVATRLGAALNDSNEQICAAASEIGYAYGVAFQIVDDVLDCLGTDESTGKTVGTDMMQLKLTLPLIEAIRQSSSEIGAAWMKRLERETNVPRAEIAAWLTETGAVDYSYEKARQFVENAWEKIDVVPDSSHLQNLKLLGEIILGRTF